MSLKHLRGRISLQITDFISFGYIPRSGTAGSYVVLVAVFSGISILLSLMK